MVDSAVTATDRPPKRSSRWTKGRPCTNIHSGPIKGGDQVLRLIHHTIKAGEDAGIPVSMSGEMAGDVNYTRLLIGMWLREFSMDPSSLLEVKRQIRLTDVTRLDRRVDAILQEADPGQLRSLVS